MSDNTVLNVRVPGGSDYEIILEKSFSVLGEKVNALGFSKRRICIVSDTNVWPLYGSQVEKELKKNSDQIYHFILPAGEENKDLDHIRLLYEFLINNHFDRHDLLAALGGGVTGDMTGFAAATYLRGIRFIQIPTTLLAMVDSSIGGKTGVDFDSYKNMVGSFHMPSLVYTAIHTLSTLPDLQFASGMGEVLKHGLIRDCSYYEWTLNHMSEIEERDPAVLTEVVFKSCRIKRDIVEMDPMEKDERMLLNFGHTLGHAIEKYMDFIIPHGQCVALGYTAASYISWKRGYLDSDEYYEIRDMNVGFSLPISIRCDNPADILEYVKHDKKMSSGRIRFILLRRIGEAFIDEQVTDEEMMTAIKTLCV